LEAAFWYQGVFERIEAAYIALKKTGEITRLKLTILHTEIL
jgi:hypothetical protein